MTLEECITECEQIMFGAQMMKQTEVYEYNRQLAEWLKELKAWRTFGLRVGEIIALYLPQEELKKLEQKISEVNKEDAK